LIFGHRFRGACNDRNACCDPIRVRVRDFIRSRSDSLSFAQNESDRAQINRGRILTSCFALGCKHDLRQRANQRFTQDFDRFVVEHEWKLQCLFKIDFGCAG
jgi:hypothetical protein